MATSTLRTYIRRSYGYARALAKISGTLLRRSPPVLIYQMGSAGSTSIRNSLSRHYPGLVHRTHGFGPNTPSPTGQLLYRLCIENGVPIRIISVVRDPIAHNISHFFRFYPNWVNKNGENWPEDTSILATGDALVSEFMEYYPHEKILEWFDSYDVDIGVNVYKKEFNKERGSRVLSCDNKKLLLMQLEINDNIKEKEIGNILKSNNISIRRRNKGKQKPYSKEYSSFLQIFKPKSEYIDKMYNNKYFNHFYGQSIKEKFIDRWSQ